MYDKEQAKKLKFSKKVLKDIFNEFQTGIYFPKKEIQHRLRLIFQVNGVQCKVTQDSIRDYYEVSESNSMKQPSYRLNLFKFPMVDF